MSRKVVSTLFLLTLVAAALGFAHSASAELLVTYGYANIASAATTAPAADGTTPFTTFSPTTGTVPNVSTTDYAAGNGVTLSVVGGTLAGSSGTTAKLLNGAWQTNADDAANSCWFGDGTSGMWLMDLQSVIAVGQINTYSLQYYVQRAQQVYSVYGAVTDNGAYSVGDGTWTKIADVHSTMNTVRGANSLQGASVTDSTGVLGNYRYLLFSVSPSDNDVLTHVGTFYGEIDVVKATVPEPSTIAMVLVGLVGLVAYAWRKRK